MRDLHPVPTVKLIVKLNIIGEKLKHALFCFESRSIQLLKIPCYGCSPERKKLIGNVPVIFLIESGLIRN